MRYLQIMKHDARIVTVRVFVMSEGLETLAVSFVVRSNHEINRAIMFYLGCADVTRIEVR